MATTQTTVSYNGTPITGEVFDVRFTLGRSREVDEFRAVSGTVRVRNRDRNFDPPFFTTEQYLLMESGDFLLLESGDKIILEQGAQASGSYGTMEIGGTMTVQDGAVTIFTGHVEDISYSWDVNGRAEATFVLGDTLSSLASTYFESEWTATDDQLSGARITEVLGRSDVDLAAAIGTIDNGHHRLQGDTVSAGANVLQYLQLIARTEYGKFYVDAAGDLQFRGRFNAPSTSTSADFDDTGTNLPFHAIDTRFGAELRAWAATVSRVGGEARTATAVTTPPAALGQRTYSEQGLLFRSEAESKARAEMLAEKLSDYEALISTIRITLSGLSTADRATVCGLDIHDSVSFTWTPLGTGTQVTQTLVVEGRGYGARETTEAYVELQLSAMPDTNYFTLDTDSLDGGVPMAH